MPPKGTRRTGRKLFNRSKKAEKRKSDEDLNGQDVQEATSRSTGGNGRKTRKETTPGPTESSRSPEGTTTPHRSPEQEIARTSQQSEEQPSVRIDSPKSPRSPTPPAQETTEPGQFSDEDDNALSQPQPKPAVDKERGSKGKGKRQASSTVSALPPPPPTQYNFSEAQEEDIAKWPKSNPQLYDMKNKAYKDKGTRRKLWEDKGAEYGVTYDLTYKWCYTQRTRFSKLSEGQPKDKSKKRSGDGYDSGEDDNLILAEVSENDRHRDAFVQRIFAFLKGHIRRVGRNTPASFKEKLALTETGELPLRMMTILQLVAVYMNQVNPPRDILASLHSEVRE